MITASLKLPIFTILALCAFAGNSVLCRLALQADDIDPASFTLVRLLSGALTLGLLLVVRTRSGIVVKLKQGSWPAATLLFIYAIFFASAYGSLDTGTGALILFGSVQITIILKSLLEGESLSTLEWVGVLVAFIGFAMLMLPGASAPAFTGFMLMVLAGVAWGLYTIAGRTSSDALADTASNFLRATPLAAFAFICWPLETAWSDWGLFLACASGALASGIGYALWYEVLPLLKSVQAAVLQLAVPFLAAGGGVIFSSEAITARLLLTGTIVCAGIALVLLARVKKASSS